MSFNFNFILPFLTLLSIVQIIKTQIKRFYSHELVEYDKNVDPRKREDSEDKVSTLETHSDTNFIHADLPFCSVPPAGSDNHFTSRLFGIFHLAHERVSRTHFGAERESCSSFVCPFFCPYRSRSFDILSTFILLLTQGLLSAIPLSYILPGLIFLKLDPTPLFSREKLPAIALVGFGLVVSISGELWRGWQFFIAVDGFL